ncbi:MAG: hypothetical protein D6730_25360 [Bacteroidetes bacterium]|nr:MAG: hypothetical protein D6730_25360 [Bacteroidota bacterium]
MKALLGHSPFFAAGICCIKITILLKKSASCFRKVSKRLLTSVNTEILMLIRKMPQTIPNSR